MERGQGIKKHIRKWMCFLRGGEGGIRTWCPKGITSPCGDVRPKIKTRSSRNASLVAGRAGFEPATGLTRHSLSRRAHSATLAPPHVHFYCQLTIVQHKM